MGATFPNGIASFPQHRNLLDDVDASDINRIQDEIVAVQSAIGALVNEVHSVENNVTVLNTDVTLLETDINGLSALEAANLAADQQNQAANTKKFADLKAQLDWLASGKNVHCAFLSGTGYVLQPTSIPSDPVILPLNAPASFQDPEGMYNGNGITLKKAGFWKIEANVRYDTNDAVADSKNIGLYQAFISAGGYLRRGWARDDAALVDGEYRNVVLNLSANGWYPAGTVIYLRASQHTGAAQTITSATLDAHIVRES